MIVGIKFQGKGRRIIGIQVPMTDISGHKARKPPCYYL